MNNDACKSLIALRELIDHLTGPDGCPWDKVQTPESLADYIIEESHELAAAIRSGNTADICEELGDVAFLLLFTAHCYEKKQAFTLENALDANRLKMIRRHPHVFENMHFETLEEQLKKWEEIKRKEHTQEKNDRGLFAGLPESLPTLIKAYRVHSKAARIGFTWSTDEEADQNFESEWLEWIDSLNEDDEDLRKHEFGDMLFSMVEIGRRKGIKANEALDLSIRRFLKRFSTMEQLAADSQKDLYNLSLEDQNELWDEVKKREADK